MKYFIFLLVGIGLTVGCNGTKKAAKSMTCTPVTTGASSGIHESRVQLVTHADEWESLWKEINADRDTYPPQMTVNFEEKILVAAFRGDCANGGYGLSIQAVNAKKKALQVNLLYTSPGKNCMSSMMITQPYEIVAIDRVSSKSIQVKVNDKVVDCEEEEFDLPPNKPAPFPIKWKEVASGAYCGVNKEQRMLIKDQASWKALWEEVGSTRIPPPELPEVNFEESVLVALFMGDRNNGGYSQGLGRMEMRDGKLKVEVIETMPGANCITTSAITQPYLIVAIDREYGDEASFSVVKLAEDCD